jgi:purine-binding chemotaxis protein CheW
MADLALFEGQSADKNKYLIFKVNNEFYGIDVAMVNNIIQLPTITMVPSSPKYFKGIINLRGEIVPVMSLRRKMNYSDDTFTKDSRIIILNIGEDKLIGVIVDAVKEVLTISEDEIEQPSPFLKKEESVVKGVGKMGDNLISILDVSSIVSKELAS